VPEATSAEPHQRVLPGRATPTGQPRRTGHLGTGHRIHRHGDRHLPERGATTTRTELFRLITSTITDAYRATAAQLAACYHQHWESETVYKSLKTHQRGPRRVLRSQDPDGVAQELYAYLITYQAIRQLIHQAAIAADIDPDRLTFTTALRAVRRFLTSAAAATGQILACLTDRTTSQILEDQHDRRDRASPRLTCSYASHTRLLERRSGWPCPKPGRG